MSFRIQNNFKNTKSDRVSAPHLFRLFRWVLPVHVNASRYVAQCWSHIMQSRWSKQQPVQTTWYHISREVTVKRRQHKALLLIAQESVPKLQSIQFVFWQEAFPSPSSSTPSFSWRGTQSVHMVTCPHPFTMATSAEATLHPALLQLPGTNIHSLFQQKQRKRKWVKVLWKRRSRKVTWKFKSKNKDFNKSLSRAHTRSGCPITGVSQ